MNSDSRRLLMEYGTYYLRGSVLAVLCYLSAFAINGQASTPFLPWFLLVLGTFTLPCVPGIVRMIRHRRDAADRESNSIGTLLLKEAGRYYLQAAAFSVLTYLLLVSFGSSMRFVPIFLLLMAAATLPYLPVMYRMIKYARSQRTD